MSNDSIIDEIKRLAPWHMGIQLTPQLNTADPFTNDGRLSGEQNDGIELLNLRDRFLKQLDRIYPKGLAGRSFLDCGCNAGGYSFWAAERNAGRTLGFDVREHWIKQARFVKENRTVTSSDHISFDQCDVYELADRTHNKFDITMFKGLFYHLPYPVQGIKIVADRTNELLWFNSAYQLGLPDGMIVPIFESYQNLMSGVHELSWLPTGPGAIAKILLWLGFADVRLVYAKPSALVEHRGRLEILAARNKAILKPLHKVTESLITKEMLENRELTNPNVVPSDLLENEPSFPRKKDSRPWFGRK